MSVVQSQNKIAYFCVSFLKPKKAGTRSRLGELGVNTSLIRQNPFASFGLSKTNLPPGRFIPCWDSKRSRALAQMLPLGLPRSVRTGGKKPLHLCIINGRILKAVGRKLGRGKIRVLALGPELLLCGKFGGEIGVWYEIVKGRYYFSLGSAVLIRCLFSIEGDLLSGKP